ncbi:MAG: hypothetical protein ACYC2K_10045 [Gemmatimonadales bacterium]
MKTSVQRIVAWCRQNLNRHAISPEVARITFAADDLTLTLRPVDEGHSLDDSHYGAILGTPDFVQLHLTKDVIDNHGIQHIEAVFINEADLDQHGNPRLVRWLVGKWAPFPTHEYDPTTRQFTVLPPEFYRHQTPDPEDIG